MKNKKTDTIRVIVWASALAVLTVLIGCSDPAPGLPLVDEAIRPNGCACEGFLQVRRHRQAVEPNQKNDEVVVNRENGASWEAPASPAFQKIEIVVLEDAPDLGAFDFGEAEEIERGFFAQYARFQGHVKECIAGSLQEYGLYVSELKGTWGLEEYRCRDPNLVGVACEVNSATPGFCMTPNFRDTILAYCPDALFVCYRVVRLGYDPKGGSLLLTLSLRMTSPELKAPVFLGDRSVAIRCANSTIPDVNMSIIRLMKMSLKMMMNDGAAMRIVKTQIGLGKAESRSVDNTAVSRPRRLVMDLSRVDPRIRLKLRLEVRKALVRSHLFKDDKVSIVDDDLIRGEINWSSADDADEFWLKVSEILEKLGLEDIDDSAVKFGADAVRVTL